MNVMLRRLKCWLGWKRRSWMSDPRYALMTLLDSLEPSDSGPIRNHIEGLEERLKECDGKLQAALDEKSTLYAELAKYIDLALPLAKPSCIVCGRNDYDEPAIKHLVIGSVVVCPQCRDAASRLDTAADLAVQMAKELKRVSLNYCDSQTTINELRDEIRSINGNDISWSRLWSRLQPGDVGLARESVNRSDSSPAATATVVEIPVTIATDRTNTPQTCRHCGNPIPCACWPSV